MKTCFVTQQTLPLACRLQQLESFINAILIKGQILIEALQKDLRKHLFESYASEVGFVLNSISHAMKQLKRDEVHGVYFLTREKFSIRHKEWFK